MNAINEIIYGDKEYKFILIPGNKVEAWPNRDINIGGGLIDGGYGYTTEDGHSSASLAQVLLHEITHIIKGTKDDGIDGLNTCNVWENPFLDKLGMPRRKSYDGGVTPYSKKQGFPDFVWGDVSV